MSTSLKLCEWQEYKFQRFLKLLHDLYPRGSRNLTFPRTMPTNSRNNAFQTIGESYPALYQGMYDQSSLPKSSLSIKEQTVWNGDDSLDGIFTFSKTGNTSCSTMITFRESIPWSMGYLPDGDELEQDENYWIQAGLLFNFAYISTCASLKTYKNRPYLEYLKYGNVKAQIFADFFSDYNINPWVIIVDEKQLSGDAARHTQELVKHLKSAGNYVIQYSRNEKIIDFQTWFPVIYLQATEDLNGSVTAEGILPEHALKVVLAFNQTKLPGKMPENWDLLIGYRCGQISLPLLKKPWQGWISAEDINTLVYFLNIRAHAHHFQRVLAPLINDERADFPVSVIIPTYNRPKELIQAIQSVIDQTLTPNQYEIIVINNDPKDQQIHSLIKNLLLRFRSENKYNLRLIECPISGLSAARNAALAQSRGKFVCFLDDDAIAQRDWLEEIQAAFSKREQTGVVGGHIYLDPPNPRPTILFEGLERFWGQFVTCYQQYTEVTNYMDFPWGANWCARRSALLAIGGFREQYGRKKNDYNGGEEIIAAALIQKLGYRVAIMPTAVVRHHPDASRYTFRYLWHTIITQIIIHYHMSRDLYLPQIANLKSETRGGFRFLKRCLSLIAMPNGDQKKALCIEYFCLVFAWLRLLGEHVHDTISRLRFYS